SYPAQLIMISSLHRFWRLPSPGFSTHPYSAYQNDQQRTCRLWHALDTRRHRSAGTATVVSIQHNERNNDMSGVRVLVGTRKGAFILTSDARREQWDINGPLFAGWEIYHLKGAPGDP